MSDEHAPSTQHDTARKKTSQDVFLEAFAVHGNVSQACRTAHIERKTLYRWKEKSDAFLIRYNQAFEEAKDNIRAEIYRRGHDGYHEDVLIAGKMQSLHKYSDTLLIFHAKMLMPEYREKTQVEHSGSIDVNGAKDSLLNKLAQHVESGE